VKSVAAVAFLLFAPAAFAASSSADPACLAAAHGMLHVADKGAAGRAALKLELEQLRCARFLSTTTVARPPRSERT